MAIYLIVIKVGELVVSRTEIRHWLHFGIDVLNLVIAVTIQKDESLDDDEG